MITVTVLVENSSIDPRRMPGRHGLSLWIEARDQRILYDFGPGRAMLMNCTTLGLDLGQVTLGVLSHSHVDHGGGLNAFLSQNHKAKVHAVGAIGTDYYTQLCGRFAFPVGVRIKENYRSRLNLVAGSQEIAPGIHLASFSTYSNPSSLNAALFTKRGGRLVPDEFHHESVLIMDDEDELSVFDACSHHGVIQTLKEVSRLFPGRRIRNYVGGFHTENPVSGLSESNEILEIMGSQMAEWNVTFFTGHCTGDRPYSTLSRILGNQL